MIKEESVKHVQYHLDLAIHAIGHAFEAAGRGDELRCERDMGDALKHIKDAAVNIPDLCNAELRRRNCDLYNNGEAAWNAFDAACMNKMHGKELCRAKGRDCSLYDSNRCFAAWILAGADKGVQA